MIRQVLFYATDFRVGAYKSALLTSSVALFAGLRHLSRFCADALAQPTHVTSCFSLTNAGCF